MGMAVSSYRYRTSGCDDELRGRLVGLAREKPRFGYRRLQVLLRPGAASALVSSKLSELRPRGKFVRVLVLLRDAVLADLVQKRLIADLQ